MTDVYQPPTFAAPIDLDLSRNEGAPSITSLNLGPGDVAALTSRYPDTTGLTEAIATRHGIGGERVLVTAGGDDALFRCFLAASGRPVVATNPTFEMVRRYAAQLETSLIEVPWWDGDFPVDDFLAEATGDTAMAVVVSPNNPTGSVIASGDLRKVADAYPLVVVDAAYTEFADEDLTDTALDMDNVVVVRTLSKAFGLAGLRVGYLLGAAETVRRLSAFGSPYSLSALSATLAARSLEKADQARDRAKAVSDRRKRLYALLDELGCDPLPSQGNFVLATKTDPTWLVPAAAALGVALRAFPGREELKYCVRITVPRSEEEFDRLEETLRTVLAPQALLFDMDGVLADVTESYRRAIVATAAEFGVTVTGDDIVSGKSAGNASDDWELTRRLCAAVGVDVPFDEVKEVFERIYQGDESREGLKLSERLLAPKETLEDWAGRLPLGIITARPRADALAFLDRFKIGDLFSVVVAREDAAAKPDPAPVRLALARLGVERAWMAGDTIDDLAAARAASVVPIGVAVPGDDRSVLASSARVVDKITEIEEVLNATQR